MTYTTDDIRIALLREHQYLCHDDFDSNDMNDAQYRAFLAPLSRAELIAETDTDATCYTLDEYMQHWLPA